jgi:transcription initiation factor TFIID subunit 10
MQHALPLNTCSTLSTKAPSFSHIRAASLKLILDICVQIPDAVTAHYLTLSGLPPPSPQDPTGVTTNTTPLPLARLLALATQKFIADIAADAYQYSRIRSSNSAAANNPLGGVGVGMPGQPAGGTLGGALSSGKGSQTTQLGVQRAGFGGGGQGGSGPGRTVLTMEDLGMAVGEYGVNVKRSEFYR